MSVCVATSFPGSLILSSPRASEERPWHTLVTCLPESLALWGGKMREPGYEVVRVVPGCFRIGIKGGKHFKPRPQNRILVPLTAGFF